MPRFSPAVLRFFPAGLALVLAITGLLRAAAQADDNVAERLRELPRPWTERIHRLTLPEYQATVEYWGGKFRDRLNVEQRGSSTSGLPLYLLKITDHSVPDTDKQVCLVTALHGGPERSGSTTALRLIEWLLSDAPAAVETRRKQVVLVMPIPNPYAFFVTDRFGNEQGLDVYNPGPAAWDFAGPKLANPARTPEIAAILSVVDEYRPEIHADLHGTGLQAIPTALLGDRTMFRGQTMFVEVLGAISNSTLRPWDWRISEAIDDGARAAGYGLDRNEADGQRLFWGPGFETMTDRVWMGRPLFYTAHYGYAKYHTMIATLEIGWEESGLARMQALFRIGNERWRDEDRAGYPVDKLRSYVGLFVTAYGETAAARRASRTELWSKQGGFALANFYPQTDGHGVYVCAVTPAAIATLHENIDQTLTAWRNFPGLKSEVVEQFVRLGPEQIVTIQPPDRQHAAVASLEHGISLRTRIPNRDPRLLDVRLNGMLLTENRVDGYHTWYADGWTYLQVNVPPEKARALGLLVFTYAYRPDTVRSYGFEPPAEVREKLRGK